MKEQYVGDVNDYRKYALLRALARGGACRLGVCWMLTAPDGRPDGRKVEYLSQPEVWSAFDAPLFELLRQVVGAPDRRRLSLIEESGIVPGATFHNEVVPDALKAREQWFSAVLASMAGTDLLFFDPDNGMDVASKPKGRKDSSKFVFRDEIAATYAVGHSVLIYQHFTREERVGYLSRLAKELCTLAPGAEVWSFETSHVAFLLLAEPKHRELLRAGEAVTAEHLCAQMFRRVAKLSAV